MDNRGPDNSLISGDLNTVVESSADPPDPPNDGIGKLSLSDVAKCLNDSLNIQDDQISTGDFIPSPEKSDKLDDIYGMKTRKAFSKKCVYNCASFPSSTKTVSAELADSNNETGNGPDSEISAQMSLPNSGSQSSLCSMSLPATLKLVSAMKGSREKLGKAPEKRRVTWAPDVYDPPPTAVSHVPTSKGQRHRSDGKKNGKNKQRGGGKSSRSSKSKDKKQARKYTGSSSRCYKVLGDNNAEAEVASTGSLASMAEFEVGSPDAFCGSSFLKKSVTNIHYPVAEAT